MNVKLKTALLGFAVVVTLALAPSTGLAGEPVLDPPEADVTFAGSEGVSVLHTKWVGAVTCETIDATGTINAGGKSGSLVLDMTGCHLVFSMGFTNPCHSFTAPLSNTIKLAGSFVTTYLTDDKTKPGIKFTIATTRIMCLGGEATLSGSVLGTLSSPACGVQASKGTIKFATEGPELQEHRQITGTGPSITLTSTGGENAVPGGLDLDLAIGFSKEAKITCV